MKTTSTIFHIAWMLLFLSTCTPPQQKTDTKTNERPNIVFIIADDMAWNDCGAYGHPHIQTPHLDRLAKEGMRFDQAFLTTSSCSPSRSSIITGQYPHNTDAEQLHWPLPGEQLTFVEKLKDAGYWTAQAGKWHLGKAVRDRFDLLADVGTAGFQLSAKGEEQLPESDGSGCHLWKSLLKQRPKDQPFFLWLAALDPHRAYKEGAIPQPHQVEDVIVPVYLPDNEAVRKDLALYYDEISRLDTYVGKVLAELDRQGVADNTLVLFISDNGRPFPRDKTTLYDGGIKTPWIVRWPAKVQAGSSCQQLVSAVDIAPTFLQLADVQVPPGFEGKDFSGLLMQPEAKIREYIYAEDHWHDFDDLTRAVRSTQYKYIRNYYPELANTPPADALRSPTFQSMRKLRDEGKLTEAQQGCFQSPRPEEELYDTVQDPNELNNLAANPQFAEVLSSFRAELSRFQEESGDKIPVAVRAADEFDRESGQPLPNRKRPRASKREMMESPGK